MTPSALPPLPYLVDCSEATLQQLELAALDLASNCMKRAEAEMRQAVAHREIAGVYRFLIEHRDDVIGLSRGIADGKQALLKFPEFALARKSA